MTTAAQIVRGIANTGAGRVLRRDEDGDMICPFCTLESRAVVIPIAWHDVDCPYRRAIEWGKENPV